MAIHIKIICNSEIKTPEYEFISKQFNGYIICPNENLGELKSIGPKREIVTKVDYQFISENNGKLGIEAFIECTNTFENNIPVYVIRLNSNGYSLKKVYKVIKTSKYNLFEYGYVETDGS